MAEEEGRLAFTGTIRGNALLLSLGRDLVRFRRVQGIVDPMSEESVNAGYGTSFDWDTFDLDPGGSALVSAAEHVRVGPGLLGTIGTLSHVARLGLFAHLGSPFIEPGFSGNIALELFNASPNTVRLRQGMPVAKVFLFEFVRSDEVPCGAPFYGNARGHRVDLRSRYFEEFGQPSRGEKDDEV
jgi:dCTP deaminase